MHDDQHGTAMISCAALINAIDLVNKKIKSVKLVMSGAGSSAISSAKLYISFGLKRENIIMVDSKGVINNKRTDLNDCLLYTSPSPRDRTRSRMPSSA